MHTWKIMHSITERYTLLPVAVMDVNNENFSKLTIVKIKEKLKAIGGKLTGNKTQLIAR